MLDKPGPEPGHLYSGLTRYVCSVIHKEQSRLQVLWLIQERVASAPVLFLYKAAVVRVRRRIKQTSGAHKSQRYQQRRLRHPCVLLLNVIVAGRPLARYFLVRNQDQIQRVGEVEWGEQRRGGGCNGNND